MLHIVLFQPEIPPNTGNIIRLCANMGFSLHLIRPLGFTFDDKRLRRAGLDYHEFAKVRFYDSLEEFRQQIQPHKIYACTTKGSVRYTDVAFVPNDAILMGPETRGLSQAMRDELGPSQCIKIPMGPESRSLNLSNATAVIAFEAWRQLGFAGAV